METEVQALRLATFDLLVGRHIGSDRLIKLGLDALLAGVDSPSLPLLAGLSRAEEPEARELFDQVTAELGLAPAALPEPRTWSLALWWAGLIAAGTIEPRIGGYYIYWFGRDDLPEARSELLFPLISSIVGYDDELESFAVWDTERPARLRAAEALVVERARALVAT